VKERLSRAGDEEIRQRGEELNGATHRAGRGENDGRVSGGDYQRGVALFYRGEGARRLPVKERSWRMAMDFQCGHYKVEGKGEGESTEHRFDGEGRRHSLLNF
jgi:hypothetical protein